MDLVIGPGVLAAELVAREADDLECVAVLALEVLVQLFKAGELRGEAAFGGGVDDEDDFAVELREGVIGAALWGGLVDRTEREIEREDRRLVREVRVLRRYCDVVRMRMCLLEG